MNINICAGFLKHRARIEHQSNSVDNYGEQSETWTELRTVWANIRHIKASEVHKLEQDYGRIDSEITIRHASDITTSMRFVINGATYYAVGTPLNLDEQSRFLIVPVRKHDVNNLG
jgi:SPP1 family predicted phage head-tail adaptor